MQKTGILHLTGQNKRTVNISFDSAGVVLDDPEFAQAIPLQRLQLEIGGANNHLFFLRPFDSKEYCIQFEIDQESRNYIQQLGHLPWLQALNKYARGQKQFYLIVALVVFVFGMALYGLLQSRSLFAAKIVNSIPYETERMIGERLVSVMLPPSKLVENPAALKEMKTMLRPLIEILPEKYAETNFYIAKDPSLNAFAMPGGNIIINRGLLEKAENDLEVIGVVAHELAHITQRHVLRSMVQGVGIFLIIQTLLGDMTGLIAVLSDQGAFLLTRSFSREMETEADRVGFDYLNQAQLPATGLISFFQKIIKENEQMVGETLSKVNLSLLSTHPHTEERIDEIKKMIENQAKFFEYKKDHLNVIKTHLRESK